MQNLKNIASLLAVSAVLSSCMRHSDNIDIENGSQPYTVGGYANSDAVAADNLVTKLSFENNLNDSFGGLTNGTGTNAGYATGIKGNCWDGSATQQRYAVFNMGGKLAAINGFTYTFWLNSSGTVANKASDPVQGAGAQGILELVDPTGFWGNMDLFLQNPDASNPGRLQIAMHVQNKRSGVSWGDQWPLIKVDGMQNKWFQLAITYNPATGVFSAYVNGALAANVQGPYSPAAGYPGTYTWYASDPGTADNKNGAPIYGNIVYNGTLSKVVFGSFQFQTKPALNGGNQQAWATDFAGKLDELRIYNAALSSGQISALYNLEKVGN